MRRLREEGRPWWIAARFGVDESYVSRIVSGKRLKKDA
jgi:hypothetical protein